MSDEKQKKLKNWLKSSMSIELKTAFEDHTVKKISSSVK